jgi:hypothetical protein
MRPISKRSGRIQAPKKMADEIYKEVRRVASSEPVGMDNWPEYEKIFSVDMDLSDVLPFNSNKWLKNGLTFLQSEGRYKSVQVIMEENVAGTTGEYRDCKGHPQIMLRNFIANWKNNPERTDRILRETIEHELIHVVQYMMGDGLYMMMRTVGERPAGLPGNYREQELQKYQPKQEAQEWSKSHALSDIEFFTRLNDSVISMKHYVFGGGEDYKDNIALAIANFKSYLQHADATLPHLKGDPGKYAKFVRELHREFEVELSKQTKTASLSKRAQSKDGEIEEIIIKFVDGNEVRKKEIDFCIGGHYYRYPRLIPKNEIWIEDVFDDKRDFTADLIHELTERSLMKHLKYDYDSAHDMANVIEKAVRHHKLSKRAAMERALNVGVSVGVRKYWRKFYSEHNMPNMSLMSNAQLNQVISGDFAKSKPIHRFLLKSAEPGEFRKSNSWIYLSVYRNGQYDVIAIVPSIKEPSPETTKRRMTKEWLDTGWKSLLEHKTRPGK